MKNKNSLAHAKHCRRRRRKSSSNSENFKTFAINCEHCVCERVEFYVVMLSSIYKYIFAFCIAFWWLHKNALFRSFCILYLRCIKRTSGKANISNRRFTNFIAICIILMSKIATGCKINELKVNDVKPFFCLLSLRYLYRTVSYYREFNRVTFHKGSSP